MSKYYRELDYIPQHRLVANGTFPHEGKLYEPVEVNEWHPASQPPKPEDFEPTGSAAAIAAARVVRVYRAYFAKYGCMNCDGALVKLIARELRRFSIQPPNDQTQPPVE